jgi:5'-nucleotidase
MLAESEGGSAEEIVCEENGVLISIMLRQYFMALRTVGQWKNLSDHWKLVANKCQTPVEERKTWLSPMITNHLKCSQHAHPPPSHAWAAWLTNRLGLHTTPLNDDETDTDLDEESRKASESRHDRHRRIESDLWLMRKYFAKWARKVGVQSRLCDLLTATDHPVDWTQVIAPELEGRIIVVE